MAVNPGRRRPLTQLQRVLAALIYVAGYLILATYLNGQLLPPFGLAGLWFYSAFAALVLGQFLIEPFFTRPADAIANGVAVLITVTSVDTAHAHISGSAVGGGRLFFIGYALIVLVLAMTAVIAKDRTGKLGAVGWVTFQASGVLGRSTAIYSLLLLASGYAAFAGDGDKIATLYLSWILVFVVHPVEFAIRYGGWLRPASRPGKLVVEEIRDPGLMRLRIGDATDVQPGATVRVPGSRDIIGTIVDATSAFRDGRVWVATSQGRILNIGSELELADSHAHPNAIGHVVGHTDLATAIIQGVPTISDTDMVEGDLVQLSIRGAQALYQIVDVELVEANEGGLARDVYQVSARKLGRWDEESNRFEPIAWLPAPGAVAELISAETAAFASEYIGHVPGTDYGIALDLNGAITHNTAIIGILGIGKTHLAWELISRALAQGVKVIALDITGRYGPRFANVIVPARTEQQIAGRIVSAIESNFSNDTMRNHEAGNIAEFKSLITVELEGFFNGPEQMLILNPNGFNVSRSEGRPYGGKANSLSRVTMVEVTQYIAEELLRLAQSMPPLGQDEDPRGERARVCLVLDEAHSLIPEWNSVTSQAEQHSTNSTAKAILQGRKYGFGCILITQRTANVTKSILNQCNTVFAMRIYDATGMGFLENYIGVGYAKLLATLKARQAVVFGRGSSCGAPLIVELNDQNDFQTKFWAREEPKVVEAVGAAQGGVAPPSDVPPTLDEAVPTAEPEDEIPF